MADRQTITAKDSRSLRDLLNALRGPTDCEFPADSLAALVALVPCDDVSRVSLDPLNRRLEDRSLYTVETAPAAGDPDDDLFWTAYWSNLICSYPYQLRRVEDVLSAADFMSRRQLRASCTGELFRVQGVQHNVIVPLLLERGVEQRIEIFRIDGHPFSDREKLLLTLVRPHLAERVRVVRAAARRHPELTQRQHEIVRLLAEGLTNREIAAELVLAEGTVRRHLDNIYTRLGVSSRTRALAVLANDKADHSLAR
jgi:DNA-binding CsgD family transcriptional regulator